MQCTIKLIHINSITLQIVNTMLQIENLEFSYHKKGNPIFNGINLTIQPGSVYGLLGKNGIGKSTLLYMMCGLMFPHKGSIRFDGIEVKRRLPETLEKIFGIEVKRRLPETLEKIFLVPEEFDLPSISIDDYVRRNSVFYPNFNIDQFNQYLSDFELEHTKNLAKTSMGQKKKYLVSFALATNTPLLLMDEPTNGMDIPSKSQFRKVIASGMNEQKSIVISTHQVRDLENMIDHITILDNGLLLLDADTHTISSRLRFIKGGNESEIAGAFYKVSTIAGYSAILPNETDEESLIDIEMLFNCTIGDPEVIHNIFNSSAK